MTEPGITLEGIENLKQKVADAKDRGLQTKASKEADHEILMDVANKLAAFIPEMSVLMSEIPVISFVLLCYTKLYCTLRIFVLCYNWIDQLNY